MNRLSFLFARTLRQESPLAALSVPQAALFQDLAGKRVSLVGNARGLAERLYGNAIDDADLVIRINRAPMPSPASHGQRTDWLALATSLSEEDARRIAPHRYLWISPKRKRLPWPVAKSPGFYLHPLAEYADLKAAIGAPPTTGLMLIEMLTRSPLVTLRLFGFDFFATQSLSGRRTAAQVPHDFVAEAQRVDAILARDKRITRAM